ncbi:hypothetical protein [Desulfogranum marinum]|jgi:hypothetical protein|uniref:hypothetical protein n=1 Tax=Desulfogranum marinum TaxID=453220 RepID=UPI0019633126|nr:hypothetical protein [Desulfogranum marinum]MBM9513776.1 hypothetical protein [Desulfogranum marinum]
MLCSYSELNNDALNAIQKLEKEIGKPLLSFSCKDIKPALVEQETLDKIQALEKSLSLSLVAVEN